MLSWLRLLWFANSPEANDKIDGNQVLVTKTQLKRQDSTVCKTVSGNRKPQLPELPHLTVSQKWLAAKCDTFWTVIKESLQSQWLNYLWQLFKWPLVRVISTLSAAIKVVPAARVANAVSETCSGNKNPQRAINIFWLARKLRKWARNGATK